MAKKVWAKIPAKHVLILLILGQFQAISQELITPHANQSAKELYQFLKQISGKYTLAGQHNFPASGSKNSIFTQKYANVSPIVFSQDFGFAQDGDKDAASSRPQIVKEAIQQHRSGSIITLCWHAVPPTASEPVTFQPVTGADNHKLKSVQGRLTAQQWNEVLTDGSLLNTQWKRQVDTVAYYLKQLDSAQVPVLWRPYHEMNGEWFWWGGNKTQTQKLYKQLFERYTQVHKLKNLIWVWSVDRPSFIGREFKKYYPGPDYFDLVSLDVYGNDYDQNYYDELKELSKSKPMILGEVGIPPSLDILKRQPLWTLFVIWAGQASRIPVSSYDEYLSSNKVLYKESVAWQKMNLNTKTEGNTSSIDFSGDWYLVSVTPSPFDITVLPHKIFVKKNKDSVTIDWAYRSEYENDKLQRIHFKVNGKSVSGSNEIGGKWTLQLKADANSWEIEGTENVNMGGKTLHYQNSEVWKLSFGGERLTIDKKMTNFRGKHQYSIQYAKSN